jgi:acetyl/propionyl-CoA carboxylase alpha subunit
MQLAAALEASVALGLPTNRAYLAAVLRDAVFAGPGATTAFLEERFAGWQPPPVNEGFARTLFANESAAAGGFGEWGSWTNLRRPASPSRPAALAASVLEADGRTLHFQLEGHAFTWRDTTMDPPERAAAGLADGRLAAPMNGRVVAVHAEPGERVEAGRALVVLEAMKMEHTLAAPAAVRVKAVHVAKGAQVAPGKLLVEFEPA